MKTDPKGTVDVAIAKIGEALRDPAMKSAAVMNLELDMPEWRALLHSHRVMAAALRKIKRVGKAGSNGGQRTEEGDVAHEALKRAGLA